MSALIESTPLQDTATSQYVSFYLGNLLLGLPIHQVQEINRHLDVTRVPHAAYMVRGVINLRGEVVTVIDLPQVLGLAPAEITRSSRNVIVHHGDQLIGLMVDDVADILEIHKKEITAPPANVSGVDGKFFKGVYTTTDDIVVILDLQETLS